MNLTTAVPVFTVVVVGCFGASSALAQGGTGREPATSKKPTPTHLIRPPKPNPQAPPFTKKGLVDALSSASSSSLIREVRRRGVSFDLTEEVESELNAMGAQPELIAAVRDNFRSDAVRGGVLTGKATRLVQPPYPAIARSAHVSGQVQVQIVIDENGDVVDAQAISGNPLLYGASLAAARASKFTPTKLSGVPVKVTGIVVYNFVSQ